MSKSNNAILETILEGCADSGVAPELYQYYSGLKDRRILLVGEIMDNIIEEVALPLEEMMKESDAPIELIIHSPGGSVWDSMFIANMIDNATCPINIKIYGEALSMGMLIAMAGYNNPLVTKTCYRFSIGLIHAGSLKMEGDANAVRDTMDFNEKYTALMKDYVLTHSTITKDEYEKHDSKQWYLTAEDMLNFGIVDKVVG